MQNERDHGTPSDALIKKHIDRLTGRGSPFELLASGNEPARFRRRTADLRSLFQRVKSLHSRIQLKSSGMFTFGDIARWASGLADPAPFNERYIGIHDGDPFTWMTETMFTISSGKVAVPVRGSDHVEAFRQHTKHSLFVGNLVRNTSISSDTSRTSSFSKPEMIMPGEARRPAIVLLTSGTSGAPKPVFHSHESVLTGLTNMLLAGSISAFADGSAGRDQNGPASVLLMCPLSYIAGVAQFFLSFLLGFSIVVPNDRSAAGLAADIKQNRVTSIVGISREQLLRLVDVPGIEKIAGSVRTIHVYGETLPAELVYDLSKVLPYARIAQGYGMTEAFGPIAAFIGEDAEGSCFWTLPSIEAAVLSNSLLCSHGTGRLHIRGRNIMLGYSPPQNAIESFDWFDTGDEVQLSASGKMRVMDRSSRTIRAENNELTYLADIERCALQTNVRDAAAWTASGTDSSRLVYLAVVAASERRGEIETLMAERFGVEVRALCVPSIPRRHGGKIDMQELMNMEGAWRAASFG